MMSVLGLLLVTLVVGLVDGQQVAIEDAHFTGFIETRDGGEVVLLYRQDLLRGEMPAELISRIDFAYRRGQPFLLTVRLKDGQILEVESSHRDYVRIRGMSPHGPVMVQHPDPVVTPLRLNTRAPNRRGDLTIEFLEFR